MGSQASVTPLGASLVLVGVALLVWASTDLWRRRHHDGTRHDAHYDTPGRIGWQLVILGLVIGPLVGPSASGWALGFPVGAVLYLGAATHGPLRRRLRARALPTRLRADRGSR